MEIRDWKWVTLKPWTKRQHAVARDRRAMFTVCGRRIPETPVSYCVPAPAAVCRKCLAEMLLNEFDAQ
jgi:hypothetical protein